MAESVFTPIELVTTVAVVLIISIVAVGVVLVLMP
jgi:hypothetical protein